MLIPTLDPMTLKQIKALLPTLDSLSFKLENGTPVPSHFHLTEIGVIDKRFVDCGGTLRREKVISLQLWTADDTDHRFHPTKWLRIIDQFEVELGMQDQELEVEYQQETIGKFGLAFDGISFILLNKKTSCLAEDQCGIPQKPKLSLAELQNKTAGGCQPGAGCC